MKRLLAPAVLAVAFSASLPAQNTGTVGTPASFHDKAKAELAVELIKKYEGAMTVLIIRTTVTDIVNFRERNCPMI